MNLSLGELEALTLKAAKGAGLPWGLAAEAGNACRWLVAHGFDGVGVFLGELERKNWASGNLDGQVMSGEGGLSALMAGPSLCDYEAYFLGVEKITFPDLQGAVLMAPFAARLSLATGKSILFQGDGIALAFQGGTSLRIDPRPDPHPFVAVCTAEPSGQPLQTTSRAKVSHDQYAALNSFAHKTYAPATEASRLAGAGSGLSDND